ncbi:hypothetical protein [Flavobacterium gilvum]|uniref:DUF2007 domain-containing protein n=1 Tax=Flavobacterium gilvum TaxID=1492737 RepID=A0AAC9I2W2_9FLAO|nr:hypothetical protein [Flavobacterium gilvum]AOW08556.1 hypothetical protein EM308_03040 [Flavobacterium gilvum]KFC58811.1 hypothetical protein FEM08_24090 [Flavobacterium gilvum]
MIEQKKRIGVYSGGKDESLILKNLLESFSIQVFEDASLMSVFNPWGVLIGDVNAVKLKVKEDDCEKAKKIIDDYYAGIYKL